MFGFLLIFAFVVSAMHIEEGDLFLINHLKQQYDPRNKVIVEAMNNSWCKAMPYPSRRNKRNRMEYKMEWICNDTIQAGVKGKYLNRIPNIIIHDLSNCLPNNGNNVVYGNALWYSLISDINNDVIFWPTFQPLILSLSNKSNVIYENYYYRYVTYYDVIQKLKTCLAKKMSKDYLSEILYTLFVLYDPEMFDSLLTLISNAQNVKHQHKKKATKLKKNRIYQQIWQNYRTKHPSLCIKYFNQSYDFGQQKQFDDAQKKIIQLNIKNLNLNDKQKGSENIQFWKLVEQILSLGFKNTPQNIQPECIQTVNAEIASHFWRMRPSSNLHVIAYNVELFEMEEFGLEDFLMKIATTIKEEKVKERKLPNADITGKLQVIAEHPESIHSIIRWVHHNESCNGFN